MNFSKLFFFNWKVVCAGGETSVGRSRVGSNDVPTYQCSLHCYHQQYVQAIHILQWYQHSF